MRHSHPLTLSPSHPLILLALFLAPAIVRADDVTAVRAGRILPVSGPPIVNGTVLIRNGKIAAVGKGIAIPPGAKVINARSQTVMPGLVAAATDLGGRSDTQEAVAPDYRALDGWDPFADRRLMLKSGLTTAYVPAGSRRLVRGQGASSSSQATPWRRARFARRRTSR